MIKINEYYINKKDIVYLKYSKQNDGYVTPRYLINFLLKGFDEYLTTSLIEDDFILLQEKLEKSDSE